MATELFTGAKHAYIYAKFRPSPPQSCTDYIMSYLKEKLNPPFEKAIDIGCGTGQSTKILSPYFENVFGLDSSEAQIKNAEAFYSSSNVEYKVSNCEKLPVESSSVQLVTFCQAFHWFKPDEIFPEVQRVLVPNGVIAAYGYLIPVPKADNEDKNNKIRELILQYLYEDQLGNFFDKERQQHHDEYRNVNLPFKDCQRMNFENNIESSLADYMCYLSSWSSYQKLLRDDSRRAEQLLLEIQNKLMTILEEDKAIEDVALTLCTKFFLIIGRK